MKPLYKKQVIIRWKYSIFIIFTCNGYWRVKNLKLVPVS